MKQERFSISKMAVLLVFAAILIVGLLVFDDYGMSTDEWIERVSSQISYRSAMRVLTGREVFPAAGPPLSEWRDRYYGVAMQLPLAFAEDMFRLATGTEMPTRTVFLMRHLYTFLVYWFALICFYRLNKRLFGNRWLAITGVLMVFLFGRFFAHSFYNIKDMIFASLFMIALTCAQRVFASDRKPVWCLLFAASGALLVTSRVVGALLIVLVIAGMLLQDIAAARRSGDEGETAAKPPVWKRLLPYLLVCCAYPMWIVLTPAAWSNPVAFTLGYIRTFSNYNVWGGYLPFAGRLVWIDRVYNPGVTAPRTFYLVWIGLTVPIVNLLSAAGGAVAFVLGRVTGKGRRIDPSANATLWIALCIMLMTLLYQFLFQPVVYDDWRHVFFLYPLMILFSVFGLSALLQAPLHGWLGKAVKVCACLIVAGSLTFNGLQIARNHPYQFSSYNVAGARRAVDFERDYWGLTYYNSLSWMAENLDDEEIIYRYLPGLPPPLPAIDLWPKNQDQLLPEEEQARFSYSNLDDVEYLIQNYTKWVGINEREVEGFTEIYAIWVGDVKQCAVLRRTEMPEPAE